MSIGQDRVYLPLKRRNGASSYFSYSVWTVQKTNNETVFARRSGSLGLVTVNRLDRVWTGGGAVPSAP